MNRKELIEKRSINTKVFENQDHSCTAEIYLAPVHYKDTDGTWKEMDNKLEESYETSVYAQKTNLVSEEGLLKCIFNFQLARVNSSLIEITSAHIYCH